MSRIGITGIDGFIGWHLRAFLHGLPEKEVVPADRSTFASSKRLAEFVASADVVVHLAGMNRGDDEDLLATNLRLTDELIGACLGQGVRPHILFASSGHICRDTPYGKSKRECAERLKKWSQKTGGLFTNLILPNIFGEGGRPFYNSVVATFCHQLANDRKAEIQIDAEIELLHAQRLAEDILGIIQKKQTGSVPFSGSPLKVSALLEKLAGYRDLYRRQIIPDLRSPLDLDLFNTLRSYFAPPVRAIPLRVHSDPRGYLFEVIKSHQGGQVFYSSTRPGVTRGNHYHRRKMERFCVLNGEAELKLRRLFSNDIYSFRMNGEAPCVLDIPTFFTHSLTNAGDRDLMTLFWTHEFFNAEQPDTLVEKV